MARRNLEALAAQGKDIRATLSRGALAEVAALTLLLHQHAAREAGAILPSAMMRTYQERTESEREGMQAAVEHVTVALILLGFIDPPDHD